MARNMILIAVGIIVVLVVVAFFALAHQSSTTAPSSNNATSQSNIGNGQLAQNLSNYTNVSSGPEPNIGSNQNISGPP